MAKNRRRASRRKPDVEKIAASVTPFHQGQHRGDLLSTSGLRLDARRFAQTIQRTAYAGDPLFHDVGVNHGGADIAVAEELLDGADIVAHSSR